MTATIDLADRVRRHTADHVSEKLDAKTVRNVRTHAGPDEVSRRIAQLEREWDVERVLEANASTLALTGAVLGTTVNRRWFWLTGGVLTFLLQHALSGWCPPLPVLRRLGVRTRGEVDREKFALKAVRGDFDAIEPGPRHADAAVQAAARTEARWQLAPAREPDRVRRYTASRQRRLIDAAMAERVRFYASKSQPAISARIRELQCEWSIERYLQINVAVVGLTTAALAAASDRRWGCATCAGLAFFLFHALEGFDPPLPLLRARGIRTRAEIDCEIYALKVLRGDFDNVAAARDEVSRIEAALQAVGF